MQYRVLLLTLVLSVTAATGVLFSSDTTIYEPRLRVTDPELEAGGGGSVAVPEGAAALRSNPAAFAEPGRVLLRGAGGLAVEPGTISRIGSDVVLDGTVPFPRNFASVYGSEFDDNGFGFSGSGEVFLSGFNVGIAFFTDHEVFMRGVGADNDGFDAAEGFLLSEAGFAAGAAIPFSAGPFDVRVGGAVRPMLRVRGELDDPGAVSVFAGGARFDEAFADTPVLNGFALGIDLGVLAHYGNLSVGASVRDIGDSVVDYREHSLSDVMDASTEGQLPEGGADHGTLLDPDSSYVIPMQTRIGAAYSFEGDYLQPTLFADIHDVHRLFAVQRGKLDARGHLSPDSDSPRVVDHLSAGLDVDILRYFSARAGLNSDGPSLGFGANLGPLRLDSSLRFSEGAASRASVGAQLRF